MCNDYFLKRRKEKEKKAESKTKLSNEKDCILYSGYKASIEVPALAASLLKVIIIPP